MSPSRQGMDAAFPTVVRYAGLVFMAALFAAMLAGVDPSSIIAFVIPVAGMIGYKSVRNVGTGNGDA